MIRVLSPLLSIVVMAGAFGAYRYVRASKPTTSPEAHGAPIAYNPADDRESRAYDLLRALGNDQPTPTTLAFVVEWSLAEDSGNGAIDRNNPWNTTQPGFNETQSINSDGVKGYASWQDGLAATVHTLTNGYYDEVVAGLQSNDPDRAKAGLIASPWAESRYNGGVGWPVYQFADTSNMIKQHKCPYTATMDYPEGSTFYSTGSGYWSGQYGGYHLGVDFTGNPGDPVYAPFDMLIESVGRYDDPGRLGANIQARFMSDNTLYYAGHLIDVFVNAGQTVAACTVIGTLGATAGPHVHVKLAGAFAPVPCESSPPGEYGCIDPLEYWSTH